MTDTATVVDRYFDLWNERDPERRRELIEATFADEANYTGPLVAGTGHDAIASLATQLLEHLDAYQFARTSEVDGHHGYVRYGWEIVPAASSPAFAAGVDFGVIAADGRFQSVTAFLDVAPQGVPANH